MFVQNDKLWFFRQGRIIKELSWYNASPMLSVAATEGSFTVECMPSAPMFNMPHCPCGGATRNGNSPGEVAGDDI